MWGRGEEKKESEVKLFHAAGKKKEKEVGQKCKDRRPRRKKEGGRPTIPRSNIESPHSSSR